MSSPAAIFRIRISRSVFVASMLVAGICGVAHAQYPGHINKNDDTPPTLRATGVFEWTGDLDKPKAGRLIPLAVWDGQQYQPGGLYLAQPAPLTVLTGTVYELEQAGAPKGLFNVNGAENLNGSWVAIGFVKPEVIKVKAKPPMSKHPPQVVKDADSDRPTLHRKDEGGSTGSETGTGTGSSSGSGGSPQTSSGGASNSTPANDPNQPTLHRRSASDSSSGSGTSSSSDDSGSSQSSSTIDPDRPTLHKRQDNAATSAGAPVTSTADTDPDRPKLRYGKPEAPEGIVQPSKLEGLPMNMNQMAAISDTKPSETHPYVYSWADPEDAAKMKTAMEELAQKAIAGISTGSAATPRTNATKTATKSAAARRKAAPKTFCCLLFEDVGSSAPSSFPTAAAPPSFSPRKQVVQAMPSSMSP